MYEKSKGQTYALVQFYPAVDNKLPTSQISIISTWCFHFHKSSYAFLYLSLLLVLYVADKQNKQSRKQKKNMQSFAIMATTMKYFLEQLINFVIGR